MYHSRLKIIDINDNSNQPFISTSNRYEIIFNGEIYNYKAIKNKYFKDYRWRTESDTEVLLACWEKWGKESLKYLEGMFAFVVYDKNKDYLTVVRDRFGIKPVYFSNNNKKFIVASEIKPLLKYIDNINPNEVVKTKWYNINDYILDLSNINSDEILYESEKKINYAIKSHLVSDVNLGFNVSGGVDSSMLVRTALKSLNSVDLFTVDYEGYSELPWVKQVSSGGKLNPCKANHLNIREYLETTINSQEEPFGGVGVIGYNLLYSEASKKNITVLLDGNGVDEIFLGYKKYHKLYVNSAENAEELDKRKSDYLSFWNENITNQKTGSAIDASNGIKPDAISENLQIYNNQSKSKLINKFDVVRQNSYYDLVHAKIPRALRFNDRVSMSHSKELRVPFLDHKLVEYASSIPTHMLLGDKGTKKIFRKITSKKTGSEIAYASKRSIANPQREWLANEWSDLVKDILHSQSLRKRGWINAVKAQSHYDDYIKGDNENSFFIWQWINLELWAREFID